MRKEKKRKTVTSGWTKRQRHTHHLNHKGRSHRSHFLAVEANGLECHGLAA